MPPSQLKQLKTNLHARRNLKASQSKSKDNNPSASTSKNSNFAARKETAQQKAHRLRADTLLPELQRRNKVGSFNDRRIGEDDPTLAPEEKARRRAVAQLGGGKRSKRSGLFDLEEDDDLRDTSAGEDVALTHLSRPLVNGYGKQDDYDAQDDGFDSEDELRRKRLKLTDEVEHDARDIEDLQEDAPLGRKKSKKEVMEEVMAKSKLHKHERQQAKEDDENLREELDSAMPDLLAALKGRDGREEVATAKPQHVKQNEVSPSVHPDRAAMMKKVDDADYDHQLRQMTQDKRAQPTARTKTAEEKVAEEAARLRQLEADRLRRMQGRKVDQDDDSENANDTEEQERHHPDDAELDEAAEFGFTTARTEPVTERDIEDEDDFVIDEGLVASGSELDSDAILSDIEERSAESSGESVMSDDDAEFLKDVLPATNGITAESARDAPTDEKELAYTYPCPQSHEELARILRDVSFAKHPTIIVRIRSLYHPQLHTSNKQKLARFAAVLVEHIGHMGSGDCEKDPSLDVVNEVIRHVHSLARSFPIEVAEAFRGHLATMHERPRTMRRGDLFVLTAIGSIFPTSDHFHQIVTPATLIAARWLGTTLKFDETTSRRGAYLVSLLVRYQALSRRYIPEALRFSRAALEHALSSDEDHPASAESILTSHIGNITALANLWSSSAAFIEIFTPRTTSTLSRLSMSTLPASIRSMASAALRSLEDQLAVAQFSRRPLQLHHHKPLPIKTSIPAFEDTDHFHPAKRYDPDPERSASARLRKEVKKEKRAAIRELRRDAEFVGREKLKEKNEADRRYNEKFRKLVGGIQADEAREGKEYDRMKKRAKAKRF